MTAVASRPQVIEIKPQVRPLGNRKPMVRVQVALATGKRLTEFIQHLLRWRRPESNLAEESDELRLPAAIHAPPGIPLKAQDT